MAYLTRAYLHEIKVVFGPEGGMGAHILRLEEMVDEATGMVRPLSGLPLPPEPADAATVVAVLGERIGDMVVEIDRLTRANAACEARIDGLIAAVETAGGEIARLDALGAEIGAAMAVAVADQPFYRRDDPSPVTDDDLAWLASASAAPPDAT